MKKFLFLMIILAVIASCSPVRTTTMTKVKPKEKKTKKIVKKDTVEYYDRFNDTTMIVLDDVKIKQHEDIKGAFTQTVNEFKAGLYETSCEKFSIFAGTLAQGDSLLYEAIFYDCECKILDDNIIDAKIILSELLSDKDITDRVMQKVLVRLGQIECVSGNSEKANEYFNELKVKYPNSKYIKLANCESVK